MTGKLIAKREIEKIARLALIRNSFVLVDEAFIDFVEDESVKMLVQDNPFVIVLRSLTKYYSLPGLRLGYLLGEARTVTQLAAIPGVLVRERPGAERRAGQSDGCRISDKDGTLVETGAKLLISGLTQLDGLHPFSSRTNFLLVEMEKRCRDALQLRSFLLRKKILIRPCNSFAELGGNFFRVAVRRRRDNRRLLAALREWTHLK